jgi:probable nitrogen fixation protein
MAEEATVAANEAVEEAALATPYLKTLMRLLRAHDSFGAWERKSDVELLADYVLTREERRRIPIVGDPDPDTLMRMEQFYAAVGLCVESETGLVATPMMTMHPEGFGRVVLIAGRLVVLSRHVRDVHRYGYDSLATLAAEGTKFVAAAVALINSHPEVARA